MRSGSLIRTNSAKEHQSHGWMVIVRLLASGILPVSRRLDLFLRLLYGAHRWVGRLDWRRSSCGGQVPPAPSRYLDTRGSPCDRHRAAVAACSVGHRAATHPVRPRMRCRPLSASRPADHRAGQRHEFGLRRHPTRRLPKLAEALLRADDTQTFTIAADIISWAEDLDPGWLDAPGVSPALKGTHTLAMGAPRAANTTA